MIRRRDRLTAQDIRGAWAIIPTPAKDNASDPGAADTVDLDETIRQTKAALGIGLDGSMVRPPMWNKLDIGTSVQCCRMIASDLRVLGAGAAPPARDAIARC